MSPSSESHLQKTHSDFLPMREMWNINFETKLKNGGERNHNVAVCVRFVSCGRVADKFSVLGVTSGHFSGSLPALLIMKTLLMAGTQVFTF